MDGMTCLHQAMLLENEEAFEFLLQRGARADIEAEGETV
jgi:ankyrin repeat protein